jgi:hypothetical protein
MNLASGVDVPDAIQAMNRRLGLPSGLAAMDVETSWFDRIIEGAAYFPAAPLRRIQGRPVIAGVFREESAKGFSILFLPGSAVMTQPAIELGQIHIRDSWRTDPPSGITPVRD